MTTTTIYFIAALSSARRPSAKRRRHHTHNGEKFPATAPSDDSVVKMQGKLGCRRIRERGTGCRLLPSCGFLARRFTVLMCPRAVLVVLGEKSLELYKRTQS